jgi:hypothetical protein
MNRLLQELIDAGAALTPCYDDGAFAEWEVDVDGKPLLTADGRRRLIWSCDRRIIDVWVYHKNYRLFRHIPSKSGFFCFDLDRHEFAVDGVLNWFVLLKKAYQNRIPKELYSIEGLPCYIVTPSGGVHIYFRCEGVVSFFKENLERGVEVKYTQWINAGEKASGEYRLFGHLKDAFPLPLRLWSYLQTPTRLEQILPKSYWDNRPRRTQPVLALLEKAYQNAIERNKKRNDTVFHVAFCAAMHGVDRSDAEAFIAQKTDLRTLSEIEISSTIESAYRTSPPSSCL